MIVAREPIEPAVAALVSLPTLEELVEHRDSWPASATVEEVDAGFRRTEREYAGILDADRLVGIASRTHVAMLLGGRYGFSVFARKPVSEHLLPRFLQVQTGTPLLEVLSLALGREREEFHQDVALVDGARGYLGMIPLKALMRVQSAIVQQQIEALQSQQEILEQRNEALVRSTRELRQSEGRFGILFKNSILGVALLGPEGALELANDRLIALLGPLALGATLAGLVDPADRPRFARLLAQDQAEPAPGSASAEFVLKLPARGERLFRFYTHRIHETGQLCALVDDVTEQRLIEQRLARREKSALLESLVGGIAHELNNKLLPVVGYSELLLEQRAGFVSDGPSSREALETMNASAHEAANIVRQLLQLSRPATAELQLFDLRQTVEQASRVLRFRGNKEEAHVSLNLPEEPVWVRADASQMKQVVVNIAFNALDAMAGASAPQLTLHLRTEKHEARLWIADTGPGIPAEHRHRIFDPFFTTKAPAQGTGLGLSVCAGIMKQHGGEVLLERTGSNGSVFRVTLPLAVELTAPAARMAASLSPAPAGLATEAPAGTSRILVIDDEEFITRMVQEALRETFACEVVHLHSAEAAIERLVAEEFDLVISDVRMPGIGGFGLLQWLETHRPGQLARLLFMTGDAGSPELNDQLHQAGIPVLTKPFRLRELHEQCRQLLKPTGLALQALQP